MQALPFARFDREWLVLALVGLGALGFLQLPNTQDKARLSLTQSVLEHGELTIGRYGVPVDRALRDGRYYTDKAPGTSFAAVPAVLGVRAAERVAGGRAERVWEAPKKLWLVRVATVGPFLLLLVWLLGRVGEGMAPGFGALVAVAAALGTMLGPLATILFGHVPAAALGFAAFVLATRPGRRTAVAAGVLAGAAVVTEYQAVFVALAVGGYVLASAGARRAALYVGGGLAPALALGVYNWAAFGSPLHLSYRYTDGSFASAQQGGFFGIGAPRLDSLVTTLVGGRGLLVVSPLLAAAALGLVLLWRRGLRLEAVVAGAVAIAYLALVAGYFLPYGGYSPGPRFFAPALPFLLLGLAPALALRPRLVTALVALSVVATTIDAGTWFRPEGLGLSRVAGTIWSEAGASHTVGVALVCASIGAAFLVALRPAWARVGPRR